MNVIDYIKEEVERQGHDTNQLDGIERVAWMLEAWNYALNGNSRPSLDDALHLGKLVEHYKNVHGWRKCHVIIGVREPTHYEDILSSLVQLFEKSYDLTPLEFYKEFEIIHPLVDGNGRTGKVLLNWLNGTLLNPIFPPHNLFGSWIRNP